jgi:hypothetical protein
MISLRIQEIFASLKFIITTTSEPNVAQTIMTGEILVGQLSKDIQILINSFALMILKYFRSKKIAKTCYPNLGFANLA